MGRESIQAVSVRESDTRTQTQGAHGGAVWSSSPWPRAELLLAERCAGPVPVRWVRGCKSRKALLRQQLHTHFKPESAGSLSGYISTYKIFAFSFCPTHPDVPTHPKKEAPSAVLNGNTWLFGGRRQQGSGNAPTLCHAMVTDFYVCSLRSVSGYGTRIVGSAKAPLSPLMRTTCGQGQPLPGCQRPHRSQDCCCSRRQLRNWSFPLTEPPCF